MDVVVQRLKGAKSAAMHLMVQSAAAPKIQDVTGASMVATGGEFERWMMMLEKGKDQPERIQSAILSDTKLYPMYKNQKEKSGSDVFTTLGTLVAVSVESHYELKKTMFDQFKIFLRSPSALIYEAFWIVLASLVRKSNSEANDNSIVLSRVRQMQENRLHDRAVSISIEGFPTGEIGPRRAAMLYVTSLVEQEPNVIQTNYARLLPFLRDLMSSKRRDSVMLALTVRCLRILSNDPVRKRVYLEANLFQDAWNLLVETCSDAFDELFLDHISSTNYHELCRSIRMELTNIIKGLLKDDEFPAPAEILALAQKCDPWVWIVKNSDHEMEVAQAIQTISFMLRRDYTGYSTVSEILPDLVDNVNNYSDLIKYFSMKGLKFCLKKYSGVENMWTSIYSNRPSILSYLSEMLQSDSPEYVELSLAIMQEITCFTDDTLYPYEGGTRSISVKPIPNTSSRKSMAPTGVRKQSLFPGSSRQSSVNQNRQSSLFGATTERQPSIQRNASAYGSSRQSSTIINSERTASTLGASIFNPKTPDPRTLLFPLIATPLYSMLQNPSQWSRKIIHLALGLVCNLSVHDLLAQQVALSPNTIKSIFGIYKESKTRIKNAQLQGRSVTSIGSLNLLYGVKKSSHDLLNSENHPNSNRSTAHLGGTPSQNNEKSLAKPTDTEIMLDCLSCLRNLCIDEQSCLEIFNTGSSIFLKLLTENSAYSPIHQISISILRNLMLQNTVCLKRLLFGDFDDAASDLSTSDSILVYSDTGFVDEVVVTLSASSEREAQRCAVDIIDKMIQDAGDLAKQALLDVGCLSALLVPMNDSRPDSNTEKAAKCFTILKAYQDQNMGNQIDIWTRLRNKWNDQDAERVKRSLGESTHSGKRGKKAKVGSTKKMKKKKPK
ncbi:hypothetical protein BDR26DRAFT_914262 [Obelidium mucronatum]|nr:hypothetical protein BDR26DRAFT_914262 [Obelidium mucronatum]